MYISHGNNCSQSLLLTDIVSKLVLHSALTVLAENFVEFSFLVVKDIGSKSSNLVKYLCVVFQRFGNFDKFHLKRLMSNLYVQLESDTISLFVFMDLVHMNLLFDIVARHRLPNTINYPESPILSLVATGTKPPVTKLP